MKYFPNSDGVFDDKPEVPTNLSGPLCPKLKLYLSKGLPMKSPIASLLFLLITIVSFAQPKDEKAVADAVESLRKAMIDADKKSLEDLSATELSYGHSSGMVEGKAAFVEAIVSGKSDFVTIALSEQTIKVAGNTALVRHKLSADTNNGGTPGKVNIAVLLVWQKQKGQWVLLARQAVRLTQ